MRLWAVVMSVLSGYVGGSSAPPTSTDGAGEAREARGAAAAVAGMLAGRYEVRAEAGLPAARYTVCPVQLPALGARVFYVEAAPRSAPRHPYFQRVWSVAAGGAGDARAVVREYRVRRPDALRGACAHPGRVRLAASDVEARAGCDVTLARRGDGYAGTTAGTACESTINDARYATRSLVVRDGRLELRDQGFDAAGRVAWGTRGAQRLVRAGR